jgi:hypothetical protein
MKGLIAFIVVCIVLYIYYTTLYTKVDGGRRDWVVAAGYENSKEAAEMLDSLNTTVINFMRALRDKYEIDRPWKQPRGSARWREIITVLLDNYNPDVIREHRPIGGETSFTQQKGRAMYLCMRQKENPRELVSESTMLFVLLHEMSHIAAYFTWDHTPQFWEVFKMILLEAAELGFYQPIDYSKTPVKYCGMTIDHNPYFDTSIPDLRGADARGGAPPSRFH